MAGHGGHGGHHDLRQSGADRYHRCADEQLRQEAEQLALLLCKLFNLEPRHGQKSEFAGNYFECMKSPFLGKNGHIAMRTPDLKALKIHILDTAVLKIGGSLHAEAEAIFLQLLHRSLRTLPAH